MVETKNEFYAFTLLHFSAPTKCRFYADAGSKTVKTKNEIYAFTLFRAHEVALLR